MDKITKFLLKLSLKERNIILEIMKRIISLDFDGLDMKKLEGRNNFFRIRKGKLRIIFSLYNGKGKIIDINYRGKIYK